MTTTIDQDALTDTELGAALPLDKDDDFARQILERIPEQQRHSFSDEQLTALKVAFGAEPWSRHSVDIRDSIKLWRWRFYFVFVAGRDRRLLPARRYKMMRLVEIALILGYLLFSTLLGLLALYLLKSAFGINLIPGFSLGIWDWFKGLACNR